MRTSLRTRKIQERKATLADVRRELLQSLRSCVVYDGNTVSIVWLINNGHIDRVGPSLGWLTDLVLLVGILAAHDAYYYWSHRAMHHPLLFKHFHRAHHRSVTPTPFAACSFSIPEALVMGVFLIGWLWLFPAPRWVIFTFLAWQIVRNAMGRARFELMPSWWLSSRVTNWINTTTHDDLHHAGSFNHNYGLYFTWWDRLMGTEDPNYAERFAAVTARDPAHLPQPAPAE
jgi:sterol desaturase/sphingolipid hydroxylase (fatty acid hydroxylase superfamily)